MFSTGNLILNRMNLKAAVLKKLEFDWEMCFRLCKVYRFHNLVGLQLSIKHPESKRKMTEMDKKSKNLPLE